MGGGIVTVNPLVGKFSAARYAARYGVQMGYWMTDSKGAISPEVKAHWTEGQLLRGQFLDSFARLESAVMDYLLRLELKATPGMPFSQKLKRLSAARERFSHPKKLDERLKLIGALNEIRADLVHAALTVVAQYDETKAIQYWLGFQNACYADRPLRRISLDELKRMVRDANQLARQFSHQQLKAAAPAAPASASA